MKGFSRPRDLREGSSVVGCAVSTARRALGRSKHSQPALRDVSIGPRGSQSRRHNASSDGERFSSARCGLCSLGRCPHSGGKPVTSSPAPQTPDMTIDAEDQPVRAAAPRSVRSSPARDFLRPPRDGHLLGDLWWELARMGGRVRRSGNQLHLSARPIATGAQMAPTASLPTGKASPPSKHASPHAAGSRGDGVRVGSGSGGRGPGQGEPNSTFQFTIHIPFH